MGMRRQALCLTVLLAACGEGLDLSIAVQGLSGPCDLSKVQARIIFADQGRRCDLQRDGQGFNGRCTGVVPASSGRVVLEYHVDASVLARAEKTVPIEDGAKISFEPKDLSYPDSDGDRIKDIDEHCLGRDPLKADAPSFTTLKGEDGAVGGGKQVIGERIEVVGSNLPAAEHVKVTIGPFLDKTAERDVTPLEVTSTSIKLQVPAGLDTKAAVALKVDALGISWTKPLSVVRAWTAAASSKSTVYLVAHGSYDAPPGGLLTVEPATCSFCTTRLLDVSADGRLLAVFSGATLAVVEIPTRKVWPGPLTAALSDSASFVDGHLALLSAAGSKLSLHAIDSANRTIGVSPVAEQAVPGPIALCGGRASDGRVRVVRRVGGVDHVWVYEVSGGKVTDKGGVPLGTKCPAAGCGIVACHVVDADRVVVARRDLNEVALVDLNKKSVATAAVDAPQAVDVAPVSRDTIFVASQSKIVVMVEGVCTLSVAAFGSPSCKWVVGNLKTPLAIAASPEENVVLVGGGSQAFPLNVGAGKYGTKIDFASGLTNILVQP
jgi:hypothetical protein